MADPFAPPHEQNMREHISFLEAGNRKLVQRITSLEAELAAARKDAESKQAKIDAALKGDSHG